MSAFSDALCMAAQGHAGMTTGEPHEPVRISWADVHAKACAGARVLAANGIGPGDAVAVLAAKPFEVAPIAQAAWLAGASVTMLHQPTARTNLTTYAEDTAAVLSLIGAKAAVLGDPFTDFIELLDGSGVRAFTVDQLLADPGGPAPNVEIGEDLPALLQLTSGSTSTPKAVRITHRNLWANIESMCAAAQHPAGRGDGLLAAAVPRHGHGRFPDPADVPGHRTGHRHAHRFPVLAAALADADQQVPRNHHGRTEFRVTR